MRMTLSGTLRALTVLTLFVAPLGARAWKPYTHNFTGDEILADINFTASTIAIGGRTYQVDPRITAAIQACPACFHAGAVGPDGFPDLTYGQAVIHPERTGEWLQHLLASAWGAQGSGAYSPEEKQQILAFTYGFLVHAAGDVWGHTLINEMSSGVFPAIGDVLTDPAAAAIAAKHIISEGYVNDTTPGFDGNPARGPAPAGYGGALTDVSDSTTKGYPYSAPKRFLYEALIAPAASTPIPAVRGGYMEARGPLIGFFLELRDDINDFVPSPLPSPIDEALAEYDDTLAALYAVGEDCDFDDWSDAWNCPIAILELGWDVSIDSAEAFWAFFETATLDLAYAVMDAYIYAWVQDIDRGLREWPELGRAVTSGLFDAQTRRNKQNDDCWTNGDESSLLRASCEAEVGTIGVALDESRDFLLDPGLSMMGLPDAVGEVTDVVFDVMDTFGDILAYAGMPLNPLREVKEEVVGWLEDILVDAASDALNLPLEAMADFLSEPSRYMCLASTAGVLPPPLDNITLFDKGEHALLDVYLANPTDHHIPVDGLPVDCGPLADWVEYDPAVFPPVRDTITMGKLLLLNGPELNRYLSDESNGRQISTYGSGDNVMVTSSAGTPWLLMIDGDHSWRADRWPVFQERPPTYPAGTGKFPMWNSCVLRDVFRSTFKDWESSQSPRPFPFYEDPPAPDPLNDPQAPVSTLTPSGTFEWQGSRIFVAKDHAFTLTAADAPAGRRFLDEQLQLQKCIRPATVPEPVFLASYQGEQFSLAGADGVYSVDYRSADACHTFPGAAERVGDPEVTHTQEVVLDTSAPIVTCGVPPFTTTWDTDDMSTVAYTVSDGALGSGVASSSSTIDKTFPSGARVPIANGDVLDMFQYLPGQVTVEVTAADTLGNAGTTACTFELHATTDSLKTNLQRLWDEALVSDPAVFDGLMDKLEAADEAHDSGRKVAELNILAAFVNELLAQRGKGIDRDRADQLILYTQDLIGRGG